jgi:hypothetical protein
MKRSTPKDKEKMDAEKYAKKHIMPEIDALTDRHHKGESAIDIAEDVEVTLGRILKKMADNGIISDEKYQEYTTPTAYGSKLKQTIEGASLEYEQSKSSTGKLGLGAPKLTSLRDKHQYAAYKVFKAIGAGKLAMLCRSVISPEGKAALSKTENTMADLVDKVVKDAMKDKPSAKVSSEPVSFEEFQMEKEGGKSTVKSKAERVGKGVKEIAKKREKATKDNSRLGEARPNLPMPMKKEDSGRTF